MRVGKLFQIWIAAGLLASGSMGASFADTVGQVFYADPLPQPFEKERQYGSAASQTLAFAPNGHLFRYTALAYTGSIFIGYPVLHEMQKAEIAIWDPARQNWSGNEVGTAQFDYSSALTPDGRLFLIGGVSNPKEENQGYHPLNTTSIWNSKSGAFTKGPSLMHARYDHSVTALPNSDILVIGGKSDNKSATRWPWKNSISSVTASVELITKSLGVSSSKNLCPMQRARSNHTATLLSSGEILVVGGRDDSQTSLASVEKYDVLLDQWTSLPALPEARSNHTATLLPDGNVLIVGGKAHLGGAIDPSTSALLWTPKTNRWTVAGSLPRGRINHTATLLMNGDVLISGGEDWRGQPITELALWQNSTQKWVQAGQVSSALYEHSAFLLPNGNVFLAGHEGSYIWSPKSLANNPGDWVASRIGHTVTLLLDGRFLVVGGDVSGDMWTWGSYSAHIYDPVSQKWDSVGDTHFPRAYHRTARLNDGRVLVAGGEARGYKAERINTPAEIWDPSTGNWTTFPSLVLELPKSDQFYRCVRVFRNNIMTVKGCGPEAAAEIRGLPDGRVLIATSSEYEKPNGNYNVAPKQQTGVTPLLSVTNQSLLSYRLRIWVPGEQPPTLPEQVDAPRMGGRMLLLHDGRLLFVGGIEKSGQLSTKINLWDISNRQWKLAGMLNAPLSDPELRVVDAHRVLILERELVGPQGTASLWDDRTHSLQLLQLPLEIKRDKVPTEEWPHRDPLAQDQWQATMLDTNQIMLITKTQTFLSRIGLKGWDVIQNKVKLRPDETPIYPLSTGDAIAFTDMSVYTDLPNRFVSNDQSILDLESIRQFYKSSFAITNFTAKQKQWYALWPIFPPKPVQSSPKTQWSGYEGGQKGPFGFLYTPRPDINLKDYTQYSFYLALVLISILGGAIYYWKKKRPKRK